MYKKQKYPESKMGSENVYLNQDGRLASDKDVVDGLGVERVHHVRRIRRQPLQVELLDLRRA